MFADIYQSGQLILHDAIKRVHPRGLSRMGLSVAFVLFGLTFFGSNASFSPAGNFTGNVYFWVVKMANLLFLIIAAQATVYLAKGYKRKDKFARLYCNFGLVLVVVLTLVWLAAYPGIVGVDEAGVLSAARHLDVLMSWQHILTYFWYAFALGLFPSWGSITLLEVFVSTAIFAYIAAKVYLGYGKVAAWSIAIFLLLPQVLTDCVTPHRISFFAPFELLLIFLVWNFYYFQKHPKTRDLLAICVLTGIVAAWRTEAIVYLFAVPFSLWVLGRRRVATKNLAYSAAVAVFIFLCISVVQGLNTSLVRQYQVTGLFAPLSSILRGGNYTASDQTRVKQAVDKGIDYNQLVAGDDANAVYWSRGDRSINDADLAALKRTTIKLILQNPKPYLGGALENYINSGMSLGGDPAVMDERFADGLLLSGPWNVSLRTSTIRLLRGVDQSGQQSTLTFRIFYANAIIGIVFVFIAMMLAVHRKVIIVIFAAIIAKNTIIFLTAPLPAAYYYYPLALVAGLLIILVIAQYCDTQKISQATQKLLSMS